MPAEICSLIKKLKRKKSTGCDNLPVVFLKDAKDEIKEPLTYIIHLSIRNGVVPTDEIRSNVDKGKLTGACFIDLSKAFDTISRANLLNKLPKYDIHHIELEWFSDYLFNRNEIVKFEQEYSENFSLLSGVPQGSILGPLLFLIILNDLTDVIENSKVIKYADDTVLYVSGKTATDITEELNRDLSRLDKWFHENELIMNLNKGKTEAFLFGTAKEVTNGSSDFRPSVNDKEITKTASYKYLGIPVDSTLNMNKLFDKCSSRLSLLSKLRGDLNMKAANELLPADGTFDTDKKQFNNNTSPYD
eukprot:gene6706-7468_t